MSAGRAQPVRVIPVRAIPTTVISAKTGARLPLVSRAQVSRADDQLGDGPHPCGGRVERLRPPGMGHPAPTVHGASDQAWLARLASPRPPAHSRCPVPRPPSVQPAEQPRAVQLGHLGGERRGGDPGWR